MEIIIALLISLGCIGSSEEFDNLSQTEQSTLIEEIVVSTDIIF